MVSYVSRPPAQLNEKLSISVSQRGGETRVCIDAVGGSIACQFFSGGGGFPDMDQMGRKVERGSSFGEFGSPAD